MRTTIELKDEYRAKLLEMAAKRGEKGFSRLVNEAIESYLEGQSDVDRARRNVLKLKGLIADGEAEQLRDAIARLRA